MSWCSVLIAFFAQLPLDIYGYDTYMTRAGWSSPVARQAHNLKVVGSNPTPATKIKNSLRKAGAFLISIEPKWRSSTRGLERLLPDLDWASFHF